jgi:hypothetical protein
MKSIMIEDKEFGCYVNGLFERAKETQPVIDVVSSAIARLVVYAGCLIDDLIENKVEINPEDLIIPERLHITTDIAKKIHQRSTWALLSLYTKGIDINGLDSFLKTFLPYEPADEELLSAGRCEDSVNFLPNVARALNSSILKILGKGDSSPGIISVYVISNYLAHYVLEAKKCISEKQNP